MSTSQEFEFRPLQRADFPLLSGWLQTPHVYRWWNDDPSLAAIEADYGGCVDGTEPAEVFIVWHAGAALGLIQRYRFGAYPAYMDELAPVLQATMQVHASDTGIDYLIGPPASLGKGLGSALIAAFSARVFSDDPATPSIVVPVQADNHASQRALERAGYVRIAEGELAPDNPADRPAHVIYRLANPRSFSN